MPEPPRTWHYGLIAQYWAQFNDDFRPHEIPYFRRFIEDDGQPALDVGCGTGRLLIPYLRSGLDVDGCDVSPDMIALCREKAAREGLSPQLHVQPMHDLDMPRRYRTIYVCGAFGLGSTRDQDTEALRRFREHLDPVGRCSSTSRCRTHRRTSGRCGRRRVETGSRIHPSRPIAVGSRPTEPSTGCGLATRHSIPSNSARPT